jgi:glutaredoxin
MKPQVTIYQRESCHLCEIASAQLEQLRNDYEFELESVDIESSDDLHQRYLERIPVIALDHVELYDFEIDLADLKSRLSESSAR